jgi:uncharacterized membrane protein
VTARESAAIGVFAALAYVGSFTLLLIPNATLAIVIIFFAGQLLGRLNGAVTGTIAATLISLFNPYGLPLLPILAAQVLGYAAIGWLGGVCASIAAERPNPIRVLVLIGLGVVTALVYQIPVSVADAWLFGPFWARLAMSAVFGAITVITNAVFFVVLLPALAKLQKLGIFRNDQGTIIRSGN